ncbi:MAG: winged helix-turn-helix domain-containing protein [Mangrovibacterium sp.]
MSYQHAWNLINEINKTAPEPLVLKQRGGTNGGGAEISGYGKRILTEYNAIEKQINKLINQINNEINF